MRAIILVMDSFGLGSAPDADRFGDRGANTLGSIAKAASLGRADREGLRQGPLLLPHLTRWGLGEASRLAGGKIAAGLEYNQNNIKGAYGAAAEKSFGKDTPSGHWEIAGQPVPFDWGYFPKTIPAFPDDLLKEWMAACNLQGILGNCHASGTTILDEWGEEHIRTGKPICYTSADSVFQIAAHEEIFGLERLYEICIAAKRIFDRLNIARVIARPFIGMKKGEFKRTSHRKDYTTPPPGETLLDCLAQERRDIYSIGKIADIFAHRNTGINYKAENNDGLFDETLRAMKECRDGGLIFANFVDFDTLYGHRRDVAGYAAALEAFDKKLPLLEAMLKPGDLVLVTADHGCDPTWPGTDHTREFVPCIFYGAGVKPGSLGLRDSFSDMGQTIAKHLDIPALAKGKACF